MLSEGRNSEPNQKPNGAIKSNSASDSRKTGVISYLWLSPRRLTVTSG